MASLGRPSLLLPQCIACTRRMTRLGMASSSSRPVQQQVRCKSKAAKEAERDIIVKLLKDKPRYGRAGTYVPLNPGKMRNQWFPKRLADYVPISQLKQLMADGVSIGRDTEFGIQISLQEEEIDPELMQQHKKRVRPVELDLLTPARSMELLTTFVPPTIEFARQAIEQEKVDSKPRYGTSAAADVLTAAVMAKPRTPVNGIYGSVSTADVVATIKTALEHNDEAARVILSENDVRFVDGHEGDETRVKQLGSFKVEIMVPGAGVPITRTVRVRAKKDALS